MIGNQERSFVSVKWLAAARVHNNRKPDQCDSKQENHPVAKPLMSLRQLWRPQNETADRLRPIKAASPIIVGADAEEARACPAVT